MFSQKVSLRVTNSLGECPPLRGIKGFYTRSKCEPTCRQAGLSLNVSVPRVFKRLRLKF